MRLNPLSWFRGADAPPEAKASAAGPIVSAWNVGRPVWTSRDYEKFADEAYVRNAVANRCVSLVAGGAAEANVNQLFAPARAACRQHRSGFTHLVEQSRRGCRGLRSSLC